MRDINIHTSPPPPSPRGFGFRRGRIHISNGPKLYTVRCDQISSYIHIISQHTEHNYTVNMPVTLIAVRLCEVCAIASVRSRK